MTRTVLYPAPSYNPAVTGPPISRVIGGLAEAEAPATNAPAGNAAVTVVSNTPSIKVNANAEAAQVAVSVAQPAVGRTPLTAYIAVRNDRTCLSTFNGYVSTPDHADFAITDLDVRILLLHPNWISSFTDWFIGQGDHVLNLDLSWVLSLHASGRLRTAITADGSTITGPESNDLGFGSNTAHFVKSTIDTDNGASGRTFTYYESTNGGATWNSLGSTTDPGTITLFNSTAILRIPGVFAGDMSSKSAVRVYYAELRSSIDGTIVTNPDFRELTPGQTSFNDSTGKTWTLNGASIVRGTASIVSANAEAAVVSVSTASSAKIGPNAGNANVQVWAEHTYLNLPGTSGNYASTPDHSSLDITTDVELRADFLTNFNFGGTPAFISKYSTSNHSYVLDCANSAIGIWPRLVWSADGTNDLAAGGFPNIATPFGNQIRQAIKSNIDVDNGASQRVIHFYHANYMEGSYTETTNSPFTQSGTTSIFSGSAPLEVGSISGGTGQLFRGKIFSAQVRAGIDGTVVAYPRFDRQHTGTTSFNDITGKTWTLNGTASILGDGAGAIVSANAEAAVVTVSANNATVNTTGATNAPAQAAQVVVTTASTASIQTNAAQSVVAVTTASTANILPNAAQSLISITTTSSTAIRVNSEQALVNVAANNATVSTSSAANAPAQQAIVTVVANDATVQTVAQEQVREPIVAIEAALAAAQLYRRQSRAISIDLGAPAIQGVTNASAQTAQVSVTTASTASVKLNAAQAFINIVANNATVSTAAERNAPAESAIVSVFANNTSFNRVQAEGIQIVVTTASSAKIAVNSVAALVTLSVAAQSLISPNAANAPINVTVRDPQIQPVMPLITAAVTMRTPTILNLAADEFPIAISYIDFDYTIDAATPSYDVLGIEGAGALTNVESDNSIEYIADYTIVGTTPSYKVDFKEG